MKKTVSLLLSPLKKHLLIVIIVKTIILFLLWFTLIKPNKAQVNVEDIYVSSSNSNVVLPSSSSHKVLKND